MGKVTIDEEILDGIGSAIIAKGGAEGPMTPAQMPEAIRAIPSGGESSGFSDVNFYMPDGTIAKSYTADGFAALTALPDQPEINGLTAQGWNWTLTDAKTYVAAYGKLNICGMYVTDNGETRLHITIAEPFRLEQPLMFGRSGGTGISVDWGDGSTPDTYTHTAQTVVEHTYPWAGDYVIRMSPVGTAIIQFGGSSSQNIFGNRTDSTTHPATLFSSRLRKVEIGSSVTSIGGYAFDICRSLSFVTIPSSVTSIGNYAFCECYSLSSVAIPSSVTSIGGYAFSSCYSLSSVPIPPSVTSIGVSAFGYCNSLSSVTIPSSVTSIGNYAFIGCDSLSSVTIPSSVTSISNSAFDVCGSLSSVTIPSSVTSIGVGAFGECYALSSVTIPSSVTSIGDCAFSGCYALSSVTIPSSVTSIGDDAFNECYSLSSVTIPSSVTSIGDNAFGYCNSLLSVTIPSSVTSIGNYAFIECYSLSSVTIPSSVTSIGSYAFCECYGISKYDFTAATSVPTLSSADAFQKMATDCKIVVPDALYSDWIAATNWSASTIVGHIVKASEYTGE